MKQKWTNRIVGSGDEAPDQLLANPLNYRTHPVRQQDALAGSLNEIGWIQQVIVNKTTGHLIDGHARVMLAMRQDEPTVPVLYVELTEAEERLALATLDPIGAMAGVATDKLDELLRDVQTGEAGLQAMIDEMAQANGIVPPDVMFPEFGEGTADGVEYNVCPECGHRWPK